MSGEPERQRWWRLLLSHHRADELDRCVRIPVGTRGLHFCARCFALYPALLATVALEVGAFRLTTAPLRWFIAGALVTPAVIDWSRNQLQMGKGNNALRIFTGALAGVGLGLAFSVYIREPTNLLFWFFAGSLALIVVLVWAVRPDPEPPG